MSKTLQYLRKGWTLQEDEFSGEAGYATFWLVAPNGEETLSFTTKKEARAHWDRHSKKVMDHYAIEQKNVVKFLPATVEDGQNLAAECGLNWNDLDDFERAMWQRAARVKK